MASVRIPPNPSMLAASNAIKALESPEAKLPQIIAGQKLVNGTQAGEITFPRSGYNEDFHWQDDFEGSHGGYFVMFREGGAIGRATANAKVFGVSNDSINQELDYHSAYTDKLKSYGIDLALPQISKANTVQEVVN